MKLYWVFVVLSLSATRGHSTIFATGRHVCHMNRKLCKKKKTISVTEFPKVGIQFHWTRLYNSSLINDREAMYCIYASACCYNMPLIALIGQHSKTHRNYNQPIWDDRIMGTMLCTKLKVIEKSKCNYVLCAAIIYLHSKKTLAAINPNVPPCY